MRYIKVKKEDAESIKRRLKTISVFKPSERTKHEGDSVYFPILKDIGRTIIKKVAGKAHFDIVEMDGGDDGREGGDARRGYRERLREVLTEDEYEKVTRGYDLLGNIAVIDSEGLDWRKEKAVARIIEDIHPSVKTVVAKAGPVSGRFRTRKYRYVHGKRTYIAEYRENGCTFRFDVRKTFFSNRLAHERNRLMRLTKDGESVLVLFCGAGPFAIEIAKAHPRCKVVGIDLNPYSIKAMEGNMALNRLKNVEACVADAKDIPKRYKGFADRIIMPHPTGSLEYLDTVFHAAKRKAAVHAYVFGDASGAYAEARRRIMAHAKSKGYKVRFDGWRVARPYSAKEAEIVVDYSIQK